MTSHSVRTRTRSGPLGQRSAEASPLPAQVAGPSLVPERLAIKITYQPLEALRPSPQNARTHSKKQIHKIKASLRQFGFTNPVLVNAAGEIVAGHGRIQAAKSSGTKKFQPSASSISMRRTCELIALLTTSLRSSPAGTKRS